MKEKMAKVIRVLTVPPILVLALLVTVYFVRAGVFRGPAELMLSILFLMGIPIMAYPLSAVLPKYRGKGREGQRNLAFVMNLVGFAGAVAYGLLARVSAGLMLIFLTYFLSVIVLIVLNKLAKLRASGHACSITGPLILSIHFIGWASALPCAALYALIRWASLYLKRHTAKDLTWGSLTACFAFLVSLLVTSL